MFDLLKFWYTSNTFYTSNMVLDKLQQHTIDIYGLANKTYEVKSVNARTLLASTRFDLFAKIYYIANKDRNNASAKEIYAEHIKAFNPDLKEPGRIDKNGINDFFRAFDNLIAQFSSTDFNPNISLIPVDSNGVILDGAHRVAALAFYNKNATIVQFNDTTAKCAFNYEYFKQRGLGWQHLDTITREMVKWLPNIHVACVWPKVGTKKNIQTIISLISQNNNIGYINQLRLNLPSLEKFVKEIYKQQDWTQNPIAVKDKAINCYKANKPSSFIWFEHNGDLEQLIALKEDIRQHFNLGKHSIHITDNNSETQYISELIFDKENNIIIPNSAKQSLSTQIAEFIYQFKHVHWLNLKIKISSLINKQQ